MNIPEKRVRETLEELMADMTPAEVRGAQMLWDWLRKHIRLVEIEWKEKR